MGFLCKLGEGNLAAVLFRIVFPFFSVRCLANNISRAV